MEWMTLPYKRYAEFTGRSRRMEYWSYILLWWIVTIAIVGIGAIAAGGGDQWTETTIGTVTMIVFGIWIIGNIIPGLAVQVRRWHDLGQSGWLVLLFGLLGAIPLIGLLVSLGNVIWFFMPGVEGDNQYG
jgi:uncharacterized membrane protein YhaH (DUF805 family)